MPATSASRGIAPENIGVMMGRTIDVSLIAGRRPELLDITLQTFHENMLSGFSLGKAVVNIDPVFGSLSDEDKCIKIVQEYFSDPVIRAPEKPNFCAAVAHTWSNITSDFALHLEDDWILKQRIDGSVLDIFTSDRRVKQVSFNNPCKEWSVSRLGPFHYTKRTTRIFGVKAGIGRFRLRHRIPVFTTSPSIIEKEFAKAVASMLNPEYDPEKQMYKKVNDKLELFLRQYRNFVIGDFPDYPVADTGRDWRSERGIIKQVHNARSCWISESKG